ncbi:hypothetical protein ALC60_05947 [Trachymyrmex zeteki]|uniref:Uncharacterized protein n=1 Tax=Mycetomoellerius zeteki TaxID=64791 RepID=A0A151X4I1_9HYME|nr:hypothetical protein ALC60_05947 [Trachymyrmex zeteki]
MAHAARGFGCRSQAHLVEQVIDKSFENWECAFTQQGLCRAHNIHVWNTEHFHSISTITIYKLLIYWIWPGITHRIKTQNGPLGRGILVVANSGSFNSFNLFANDFVSDLVRVLLLGTF